MQTVHTRAYPTERGDPNAKRPPESESVDWSRIVQGYTLNGARQRGLENDIGSIEAGKFADLIVLQDDVFEVDSSAITRLEPSAVMMEGVWLRGREP